jgi:group I intron endonuclease
MIKSGIYCITNLTNNKKYIGQSKDLSKRRKEHIRSLNGGYHYNYYLQRSFDKYGYNGFKYEVIEECDKDELDKKETYYIELYNTMDRDIGYNLKGGGHKPILSEESKKQISATRRERLSSGEIKTTPRIFTDGERIETGVRIKQMYVENPEIRFKLSMDKTDFDIVEIRQIKMALYLDIAVSELMLIYNVEDWKIRHIKNLDTFTWVLPELNYYISNREDIQEKKQIADILKRYRQGETYQSIADIKRIDIRTVIRKVNNNKTEFDERMRENKRTFERANKYKRVNILRKMGKDIRTISRVIGMSTGTICDILKGRTTMKYMKKVQDN